MKRKTIKKIEELYRESELPEPIEEFIPIDDFGPWKLVTTNIGDDLKAKVIEELKRRPGKVQNLSRLVRAGLRRFLKERGVE